MRRRDLLRNPAFLAALPVVLVFPFVVTSMFLHQGSISALRGWTPTQVAWAYLCFAGSQAVTTWLAGRLVDHSGAVQMFRFYLWPLAGAVLLGAFAPPDMALWGLYLGLGMASGCQSVISGALWAELFGIARLGMVRGVFTALMVLSTAASPPLLGHALQVQTPLTLLAGVVAALCAGDAAAHAALDPAARHRTGPVSTRLDGLSGTPHTMNLLRTLTIRLLALLCCSLLVAAGAAAQSGPAIAAASDLKFALDDIAAAFRKDTGQPVRISYGSSGNFMRQIAQDAPFELFLSADEAFVFQLADMQRTVDRGALYAIGRIVLFAPTARALQPDAQLADLRQARRPTVASPASRSPTPTTRPTAGPRARR